MKNVEILQRGTNLLCKMPRRDTQIFLFGTIKLLTLALNINIKKIA